MNLDDSKAVARVDRSQTLAAMEETPERLTPPPDAVSTCGERIRRPDNIVFGGVGGSGIIGDIVNDYLRWVADVPASVCRSMRLPAYVGKDTLFVAISYSGQTPETLSLLDQAMRKGATTVAVGSGGRLLDISRQDGIRHLKVTEGLLPRLALPELLAAVLFLMGRTGLVEDAGKLLRDSAELLRDQIRKIGLSSPLPENGAKQMAQALLGRLPLLFGSVDMGSVLRRFKNELNENSKMPAFYYTLPEGYHDDVEGLNMLSKLARPLPIVLVDQEENAGQRRTRERLYSLFKDLGFQPVLEFKGEGEERLGRLLTAVMFGDYVSAYLALLREVDPSELTFIPGFREAMRGN